MADRPACVGNGCALGPKSFHTPGKRRRSDRFATASGSRHPAGEDRPGPLPPCSGPGFLASSAGAEAARATSVLRSNTPAGKNHQMCARTIEMSYPRPIEMSDSASKPRAWEARVGLGDDERTRSATDRGADESSGEKAYRGFGRDCFRHRCAAGWPAAAALLRRRWRRTDP